MERYPEAFANGGSRRTHFECYLVKSEGRTVLVDTGLGNAVTNPGIVKNMFGGTKGHLLDELQSVRVQVGDIDTVFLTHLHLDHVGWNISRNGTD